MFLQGFSMVLYCYSNFDKGGGTGVWEGESQAQDHGQAIYAQIRYSVSSNFATGCSLPPLNWNQLPGANGST